MAQTVGARAARVNCSRRGLGPDLHRHLKRKTPERGSGAGQGWEEGRLPS